MKSLIAEAGELLVGWRRAKTTCSSRFHSLSSVSSSLPPLYPPQIPQSGLLHDQGSREDELPLAVEVVGVIGLEIMWAPALVCMEKEVLEGSGWAVAEMKVHPQR